MKRIFTVTIKRETDSDPDLSYLGTYSDKATSPAAIDRMANGDMRRGEFSYFNPAMTGDETGNPDSPQQDYQRAEGYNNSEWCMVGVSAVAEIQTSQDGKHWLCNWIRSGRLWGIESDSDDDYFAEVEHEQFAELRSCLAELGFSHSAIDMAFQNIMNERKQ